MTKWQMVSGSFEEENRWGCRLEPRPQPAERSSWNLHGWAAFVDYLPFNIFQPFRNYTPETSGTAIPVRRRHSQPCSWSFYPHFQWHGTAWGTPNHLTNSRNADVSTSFKRGLPGPSRSHSPSYGRSCKSLRSIMVSGGCFQSASESSLVPQ